MKNRLFVSLLLLALVVVLIIFIVLVDEQQADAEQSLLSDITVASISEIFIQRSGDVDIEFRKQGKYWFLISPVKARASMARIDAILHLLNSRSFSQINKTGLPLQNYQLNPAAITLHLQNHVFSFGTTDPIDARRYVMFNDSIHLLNDNLFHQLQQPPTFFISTRLVPEE